MRRCSWPRRRTTATSAWCLTAQQREAVEAAAPLLITGGSGSGKTTALAARVARLLRAQVPTSEILVLCSTAAGRDALEEALVRQGLSIAQLSDLQVATVAQFCRETPLMASREARSGTVLDDVSLLAGCMDSMPRSVALAPWTLQRMRLRRPRTQ